MLGGHSTSQGIVLYDTGKSEGHGILCYLENGQYRYKRGNYKELIALNNALDKSFTNPKPWSVLIILLLEIIFSIAFIRLTVIFAATSNAIAASLIFVLICFFPVLSIAYATQQHYLSDSDQTRFRRHHAAEHMILRYAQHKKSNLTLDELKKMSCLHQECGTVYMGTIILFAGILSICIWQGQQIGVVNAVAYVLLGAIALILNVFNPLNPLKLLQLPVTKRPTDKELNAVLLCMVYLRTDLTQ